MSFANSTVSDSPGPQLLKLPTEGEPLHRLAEARRRQGVSQRTVAKRLQTEVSRVRREECGTSDITLSRLYQWQEALGVPAGELLAEPGDGLSPPIERRARLVRVMKTVLAIQQNARQKSVRRMTESLIGQLLELMPELAEIGPWHNVGQRRRLDELGVAAERGHVDPALLELAE